MGLQAIYDKPDDIPETINFRELFTEKNGKLELTGIAGVKTQADIDRIQEGLKKEKNDHKATREKLAQWGDLKHDEVTALLDRIPELEAAAKGKLDEAAIEEIVTRRVEGTIKSKMSPLERQLAQIAKERDELKTAVSEYTAKERTRLIHDQVRKAAGPDAAKLLPTAIDDALMLADRVFELNEEGKAVTKDGVGVTPGIDPVAWLGEIQEKRPHWWGATKGGGGRGTPGGGGGFGGNNPWSAESWNLTKQGEFLRQHGRERAEQMAKAAGTKLGGQRPTDKK